MDPKVNLCVMNVAKRLHTKRVFKEHKSHHNRVKHMAMVKCPYEGCKKELPEYSMKKHINRFHIGIKKKHQCQYCSMKFEVPRLLKAHENSIHLNIKEYKCDVVGCDFATAYKYRVKTHKAHVHDPIMHDCDYPGCGKSYNIRGNLTAHQARVHKIVRPKAKAKIFKADDDTNF